MAKAEENRKCIKREERKMGCYTTNYKNNNKGNRKNILKQEKIGGK